MKRPLRVAVIGAGSMGRNHARVYNTDHLPHAERAAQEVLCLPVHPALGMADLERIIFEVNCL